MRKRIVVWAPVRGKLVIPEIIRHPLFELVGVASAILTRSGRTSGDLRHRSVGITATDDVAALIALAPTRSCTTVDGRLCARQIR